MLLNRQPCRKVSRLLWDYAAYRLPESDWESVEQHLRACARCRREMEQYRRAVHLVEAARSRPAPASETTWYALRAQLESAADLDPRIVVRQRQSLRNIGIAIAGGLLPVALAAAILLPGHKSRTQDSNSSINSPAGQVPDAFGVLDAVSTAFSHPLQVDEVAAPTESSDHPTRLERTFTPAVRMSDAGYPQEISHRNSLRITWNNRRRHNNDTPIQQLHRQEPQHNTPNLQYVSVDGDLPSNMAAPHNYVIDPLPSPSGPSRNYVMDMVNLSTLTPTATLASNVEGNKEQDIW